MAWSTKALVQSCSRGRGETKNKTKPSQIGLNVYPTKSPRSLIAIYNLLRAIWKTAIYSNLLRAIWKTRYKAAAVSGKLCFLIFF